MSYEINIAKRKPDTWRDECFTYHHYALMQLPDSLGHSEALERFEDVIKLYPWPEYSCTMYTWTEYRTVVSCNEVE